jgi:hypothetical protein
LPPRICSSAVISHGAGVDHAFLQRLGREAAEHHRVRGADARAGLHGHDAFDDIGM